MGRYLAVVALALLVACAEPAGPAGDPTAIALTGTVWVLEGLVQGDAVSTVTGDRATLELFSDGSMLGSTGCRTLNGNYTIVGAEVQMTELTANGDCPRDLEDQDTQVVIVLGSFRATVEGETLNLTSPGNIGLRYRDEG
ncbi:MAG: META domain-containing protein [Acidimicrobiia bacterium]